MTTKIEIFQNGVDCGYLNDQRWWFNNTFKDGFSYFDLNGFYSDGYFKQDHVGEDVIKAYVNGVIKTYYEFMGSTNTLHDILEVGSGGGWFLKEFLNIGYNIYGLEGSDAGIESCLKKGIPENKIIKQDFRRIFNLGRRFDIALCTEVAEHVEPSLAGVLVHNLVSHSDLIWFSSEEPNTNQAHYHHCNEQPDKFWINLFDFFGYGVTRIPDLIFKATAGRGKFLFYKKI